MRSIKETIEEDLQSIKLEDDEPQGAYEFDFNALKKMRKKEKIKLAALTVTVATLLFFLVIFAVMYKKNANELKVLRQKYGSLKEEQKRLKEVCKSKNKTIPYSSNQSGMGGNLMKTCDWCCSKSCNQTFKFV